MFEFDLSNSLPSASEHNVDDHDNFNVANDPDSTFDDNDVQATCNLFNISIESDTSLPPTEQHEAKTANKRKPNVWTEGELLLRPTNF